MEIKLSENISDKIRRASKENGMSEEEFVTIAIDSFTKNKELEIEMEMWNEASDCDVASKDIDVPVKNTEKFEKIAKLKKIISKSKLNEKDAEDISNKINEALSKRY